MINQERLKEVLEYDTGTGAFTRKLSRPGYLVGSDAGYTTEDGYRRIGIDGNDYLAHRLAFLYVEGYFPEHDIDHMDGVRDNNKYDNLRHASRTCNLQNQKTYSNSTSGFTGVSFLKRSNKWVAHASLGCGRVYLGLHETALDAALARLTWETQCSEWSCNHRNGVAKAIENTWPEFKNRHEH